VQITEYTDTRLVLTSKKNEGKWVLALGAVICAGFAVAFYASGEREAFIFGHILTATALLSIGVMFLRRAPLRISFDTEVAEMILSMARGSRRRVIVVPFADIGGIHLRDRGNPQTGYYKQVEFTMTEASGKGPINLPNLFGGMSEEDIHSTIKRWVAKTGAFPNLSDPDSTD